MIFDENGSAVIPEEKPNSFDVFTQNAASSRVCGRCGCVFILGDEIIAEKEKERMCPICGAVVGVW